MGDTKLKQQFIVVTSREDHFACGCTTTRIERVLVPDLELRRCRGHHLGLVKRISTIEFHVELRPTYHAIPPALPIAQLQPRP